MALADFEKLRGKWTKARDDAKVKSGAVKGVSIGDLIDGVWSARKKGLTGVVTAANKLIDGCKKYKAGVKNKTAEAWLATNVESPAKNLLDEAATDAQTIQSMVGLVEGLIAKCGNLVFPNADHFRDAHQSQQSSKTPMNWADASDKLYTLLKEIQTIFVKFIADLKALAGKIALKLPNKATPDTAVKMTDGLKHEADRIGKVLATQSQ
ncbi:MAG TPA: hypothetical protein VGE52_05775, partial [Pirellulales bacterium]